MDRAKPVHSATLAPRVQMSLNDSPFHLTLQAENSALAQANENQRETYERCLDEVCGVCRRTGLGTGVGGQNASSAPGLCVPRLPTTWYRLY
jgi:hypothetical protein